MIKWKKMIKGLLAKICGRCPCPPHKVRWRRQNTLEGIIWKRIHELDE